MCKRSSGDPGRSSVNDAPSMSVPSGCPNQRRRIRRSSWTSSQGSSSRKFRRRIAPPSRLSGPARRSCPHGLVGKEGDTVSEGLSLDEAHAFLVAGLAEEALAGPEHDREDL